MEKRTNVRLTKSRPTYHKQGGRINKNLTQTMKKTKNEETTFVEAKAMQLSVYC
ncbi:hypothetical protein [Dysgonomonas termitidis]|uniref:Uncharacterized protein n=1 Tax=Dysgonomonas termitidis TaxID=1516126 RepID=A0ABV9KPW4_9BACT